MLLFLANDYAMTFDDDDEVITCENICFFIVQAFRGKGMNGVMTFLFTKIIRQHPEITYEGLIQKMDEEIQLIIQNSCHPSFLRHMFRPKISQVGIFSFFFMLSLLTSSS